MHGQRLFGLAEPGWTAASLLAGGEAESIRPIRRLHSPFVALAALAVFLSACAPRAVGGPILWIDQASGPQVGTVDAATGKATVVGNAGVNLSDIAFSPTGQLYGIDLSNLYTINTTTGAAMLVAPLSGGVRGQANALVFSRTGTLFTAGFTSTHLFTINPTTGATTDVGNVGTASSGDLAFANGFLYLTGANNDLIRITLSGNNVSSFLDVGPIGFSNVYGLASPDGVNLYGVAGTQVLSINPLTGAGTVLSDYGGQGLAVAGGAAFITEATTPTTPPTTSVPEPSTLALLALGVGSLAGWGRWRRPTATA
jgi:hypothetical protein